jgi:hypothetical protein
VVVNYGLLRALLSTLGASITQYKQCFQKHSNSRRYAFDKSGAP